MKSKAKLKQLIEACKRQDWSAQKELYLLYADDMMSTAIRYSTDISAAKDLVQETFILGFTKIEQFDDDKGSMGAWLRRILINKSYANYRKNKRMTYDQEEVFPDQVSEESSALDHLEAEDILKMLQRLPEGCSIIFNMKVIEGYSHVEIAKMLKITAGASRSQLSRAKTLLRAIINETEENETKIVEGYRSKQA